jgi:hypothetical protein
MSNPLIEAGAEALDMFAELTEDLPEMSNRDIAEVARATARVMRAANP